jgi:hypothetical protein
MRLQDTACKPGTQYGALLQVLLLHTLSMLPLAGSYHLCCHKASVNGI